MAARVNTKFVILLSGALTLLAVLVVGAAMWTLAGKGERHVRKGDAFLAEGNYEDAAKMYGRAVGKDQTNIEWLEKWRDALVQVTPATRAEYEKQYQYYFGILLNMARVQADDADVQITFLEEMDRRARAGGLQRTSLEELTRMVTERASGLDTDSDDAKRVLRYRGLARVDLMTLITVDPEIRRGAMEDLRGAVEADPSDIESALGIVRWHNAEVQRLRGEGRNDLLAVSIKDGRDEMDRLVARFPNDPRVLNLDLAMRIEDIGRRAGDLQADRAVLLEPLRPQADRLLQVTLEAPIELLRPQLLESTRRLAAFVLGSAEDPRLRRMVDRALEAQPNNANLMLVSGRVHQERFETEEAIADFQRVIDLPDPPVSLEGLLLQGRRDLARALQVDAALLAWAREPDPQAKAAALDRAKQYRDRFAQSIGARNREALLLRNAKIAMAENRLDAAVADLNELRSTVIGESDEVLTLLATALEERGNIGDARQVLRNLDEKHPSRRVKERLAEVEAKLQNYEAAEAGFQELADMFPEDPTYKQRLAALRTLRGDTSGQPEDPVVRAILEAGQKANDGDLDGSLALLQAAHRNAPNDFRLVRAIVQVEASRGNREGALAVVETALGTSPNDQRLLQLKTQLEIDDPVEAALKMIADSDDSELEKTIARYQVFAATGRTEEQEREITRLNQLAPNDSRVLELLFLRAASANNVEEARRLARRAAEHNADQLNGLLFQGRVEMMEGRFRDAASTLEQAVSKNPYSPGAWRLLGEAQRQLGRTQDALRSFARSHEGDPLNSETIKSYSRALIASNRPQQALELVRPIVARSNDGELREIWLLLESEYGDAQRAIEIRESRFNRDPSDVRNAMALIAAMRRVDRTADAERVLAGVQGQDNNDALMITVQRARLAQDKQGIDGALAVFAAHIAGLTEQTDQLQAHLSLGEFLFEQRRFDDAESAFNAARAYQDPKQLEADRRLGDFYFVVATEILASSAARGAEMSGADGDGPDLPQQAIRAYTSAADAYARVLAGGIGDEAVRVLVQKRYAETLIRLERFADAGAVLGQLTSAAPDDLQVMVLRASLARSQGDMRTARETLNSAVEKFPSDPLPFVQRALLLRDDPAQFTFVMEDLDHVVRLRPGMIEAWMTRYDLQRSQGRMTQAITELRRGLEANPESETLLVTLVEQLYQMPGAREEAVQITLEEARKRPTDESWLYQAGRLLIAAGRHRDAVEVLGGMHRMMQERQSAGEAETARVDAAASMYLDAILRSGDQTLKPEVNRLLARLEPMAKEQESVSGLMLVARARMYLDDRPAAMEAIGRALRACKGPNQSALSQVWMVELNLALGSANAVWEQLQSLVRSEGQLQTPLLTPFLRAQFARMRAERSESPDVLLTYLEQVERQAEGDPLTMLHVHKVRGLLYYNMGRYEDAEQALRAGHTISPNDPELNNNLAYTIAAHLGNSEYALPYAERAVRLQPFSSPSLDTLGWILYKLERYREAAAILERAVTASSDKGQTAVALVHLGHAELALNARDAARTRYREAAQLVETLPATFVDSFREDLESLRKALNE